ncbi:hypothetical protein ACTL6P_20860 [Endozoicomonas acroporae]|uniref:hypothetical protein n=1 Tax=Endozoicomonas TaxID=305899 RepID=UPI0011AF036F|nr:hypothetical protein [Endozoicomonas acroporae]
MTLWIGWNIISYQSFVYYFQNSTYESMSIFRVVDDQGHVIAMQRTDTFQPGERKSIGGIDYEMPSYLLINSGSGEKKRQNKLYVSKNLPWGVWLKLTFIPWKYTADFIINVLPDNQSKLTWVLTDKQKKMQEVNCGGWLVDHYYVDVIDKFKHVRFSVEHPRESYICNPLSYIGFERKRIEAELSKK